MACPITQGGHKKHAFTNQKKCTATQNKQKIKPGLITFYNIKVGNGAGLYSKKKVSEEKSKKTRMWADAQRDGRPAEYRWRHLFNATKFG